MGDHVADYVLRYADGSEHVQPIRRRFAIQQARIGWGASPFAAVPMHADRVVASAAEDQAAGRLSSVGYGRGETRHGSGRDGGQDLAWLYALPNPHPDRPIDAVELRPGAERCAVYGIATTDLTEHPLRPGTRRKLRLDLTPGATFGADGQLAGLEMDLGTIISARPALDYDSAIWTDGDGATAPDVQPAVSATRALVEYAAHSDATLYLSDRAYLLRELEAGPAMVAAAERPVKIRVVERGSSQPVAVRLHLHGAAGEYLPPKGNHRTRQRQLVRGQLRRVRQRRQPVCLHPRRVRGGPAARRRLCGDRPRLRGAPAANARDRRP